ncbi:predicted protein [Culex quinquefasciatus]|uniref:Predicted protein n=2 Tax=Culex pipiens complex TaxID=518105 RepID=B0XA03_CULQU|nr:predicted protein [Culex quinquefasciatus]|eukprot:XP_001866475.1 predicted protein [Culex quinquefasciatus]
MSVAQVSKCRSVGLEADSTRINKEVIVLKGKSVEKLIASGREKLSSGGAVPTAATEEKKADKKMEGSGFEDDMGCGLFEQGNIPRDHIPGWLLAVTLAFLPPKTHDRRSVEVSAGTAISWDNYCALKLDLVASAEVPKEAHECATAASTGSTLDELLNSGSISAVIALFFS